jgi:hypothetical protein
MRYGRHKAGIEVADGASARILPGWVPQARWATPKSGICSAERQSTPLNKVAAATLIAAIAEGNPRVDDACAKKAVAKLTRE